MPVIRNKAVLHILDGIKGLYHGGPGAKPQFVWEHQTMYFATDPVALDHIGWKAIDEKRLAVGNEAHRRRQARSVQPRTSIASLSTSNWPER